MMVMRLFQFLSIERQALRLCCLLTQTECLDYGTIAINITVIQIFEQCTTLSNESRKRSCCHVILVMFLNVLGEMLDAISEQSYLALSRTSVCCSFTILGKDFFFFCFV